MENNLAAEQPEQPTAAPVVEESAPSQDVESKPVEKTAASEKEPEWFVKRIGEMTAKWRSDERRADEAERERDYYRQQLQQQAKPEPVADEKPKTLADFDYDEGKFQAYIVQTAREEARKAAREADRERSTQEQEARRIGKFKEREAAFAKDKTDYRDVAYSAPISNEVAKIITDLESGPELAYYLGKNPDIAHSISDLPPHIAAVELGRIDAKLSADKAAKAAALEKAKAEKAVSKAPDPVPRIEGAGDHRAIDPDSPDSDRLSAEEWARRRDKQIRKRYGSS